MSSFPQNIVDKLTSTEARKYVDQLEPTFRKAPRLPKGLVEFLVTIAPWLAGLAGVFGAFSGLGMVLNGLGIGVNWWMRFAGFSSAYFLVMGVFQLLSAGLLLLAFTPLRERKQTGWLLLFWNMVVSVAQSAVGLVFGYAALSVGGLLWMALWLVIGLYILFELRSQYKS